MPDDEEFEEAAVVSQARDDLSELEQARLDQGMTGERVVYAEAVEI